MKVANTPQYFLWRQSPAPEGEYLPVKDQLLVGRSRKCHLILDDVLVSRRHALFDFREGRLCLTDMTSRNGTFVNEEQIKSCELDEHDEVRIGRESFRVVTREAEFVPTTAKYDQTLIQQISDEEAKAHQVFKQKLPLNQPQGYITDGFLAQERRGNWTKSPDEGNKPEQQRSKWFDVIFKVHLEIQTRTDEEQLGDAVCDLLLEVLDCDRCLVALLESDETLKIHNLKDRNLDEAEKLSTSSPLGSAESIAPVQMSRTVTEQVLQQRCAINISDIRKDERFGESDSLLLSPVRSMLVAPIMLENRVLGLIEVSRNDRLEVFTESGLELLSIVASMLGAALHNFEQSRRQESYIEELKDMHEQLRATQADLVRTQQLAILGRMASSINHEIGNLFMPLLEYHQSKQEGAIEEDLDLFSSDELAYCCTQIQSLIEDIKYFSQGAHRPVEMHESHLDKQVENAVRFVQIDRDLFPKGGPRPLQPRLEILARPRVYIDPLQIGRVVINLLRNAAQAMLKQEEAPEIIVRVFKENDTALIEIEDNGPGVPQGIQDKLFEPFFTTKGEQGLGLGLDISRKIVHAHRGKLNFERRPEGKTCFQIQLPLQPTLDQPIDPLKRPPEGHAMRREEETPELETSDGFPVPDPELIQLPPESEEEGSDTGGQG
ncbi:MAG: ATP-binding protein [Myxococcota bacterium]|nr:ATP-binding protein [Myxococcota bacterium]